MISNKKLCGYDLNGWKDRAARNWIIDAEGAEQVGAIHTSGSVVSPCIVQIGQDPSKRWIGGSQASLAPHGRGGGWGEVGSPEKRKSVLSLFEDDTTPAECLAAAVTGLAHGAKFCTLSIDDSPQTTERFQERLIEAMAKGKIGRSLLVWRSVLAVLGCLNEKSQAFKAQDGLMIGVIGHVANGFTLQRLRLRLETGRQSSVFAPERSEAATLLHSSMGYEGLLEQAKVCFRDSNAELTGDWLNEVRSVNTFAFDGTADPELVQHHRGRFALISPPPTSLPQGSDLSTGAFSQLQDCDIILFETLTTGAVKSQITAAMASVSAKPITTLGDGIVVRGALEAAHRFAEGDPVYFDFLPQISTIVIGKEGAASYDLIGSAETLPAGRIYQSANPAEFAIQANQSEFTLYIKKELETWPREAQVLLGSNTNGPVPVQLGVEQTPASGRARLIIEAHSLSRQFIVDWENAREIKKPWEALVEEQGAFSATIPSRMVLECGMDAWEDTDRSPGLLSLLYDNSGAADPDWNALATKLAARPHRRYCISSDGEVPDGVPTEALEKLDELSSRALNHVNDRIEGRIVADNASLKFLTWQFRRAPAQIPKMLLEAWEARNPLFNHPFVVSHLNWQLIYQGLGRTSRTEDNEKIALSRIFLRDVRSWSYNEESAAAAFLLSRSQTAPLLLERQDVERLAARVLIEFENELGTDYTRFFYAPILLVGILRWRLKVKNALIVGQDPFADSLHDAVLRTRRDFTRTQNRSVRLIKAADKYDTLLAQILEELEGQGSNPNLLVNLYDV